MIWPFLLIAYLACGVVNWRAGLVLIVGLVICRLVIHYNIGPLPLVLFAAYSTIGVLAFLFVDKTAGAIMCVSALAYGIPLIDITLLRVANITAEVVFFTGALACGIGGPGGGLKSDIRTDTIWVGSVDLARVRPVRFMAGFQKSLP